MWVVYDPAGVCREGAFYYRARPTPGRPPVTCFSRKPDMPTISARTILALMESSDPQHRDLRRQLDYATIEAATAATVEQQNRGLAKVVCVSVRILETLKKETL